MARVTTTTCDVCGRRIEDDEHAWDVVLSQSYRRLTDGGVDTGTEMTFLSWDLCTEHAASIREVLTERLGKPA